MKNETTHENPLCHLTISCGISGALLSLVPVELVLASPQGVAMPQLCQDTSHIQESEGRAGTLLLAAFSPYTLLIIIHFSLQLLHEIPILLFFPESCVCSCSSVSSLCLCDSTMVFSQLSYLESNFTKTHSVETADSFLNATKGEKKR